MCPKWSAVVGTDHHSEKIATTTNSLTTTKISTFMKILSLNYQQNICMYIHSVYKESPRHYLRIEIKDHNFCKLETDLYNHHSSKPGHTTDNVPTCGRYVHGYHVIINSV